MDANQISDADNLADIVGLNSIAVDQVFSPYWAIIFSLIVTAVLLGYYRLWTKSKHSQLFIIKQNIIKAKTSPREAAHQLAQLAIIQPLSIEQEKELKQLRFAPNEPSEQIILSFISRV